MSLAEIREELAELRERVAKLERERRKPAHWADFSPKQRAAVEAVVDRTNVAWNEISASGSGPRPHSRARRILMDVLIHYCGMSNGEIARFMGRTPQAVTKAWEKHTDGQADQELAQSIMDDLYANEAAKAQAADLKAQALDAKSAAAPKDDWWS